MALKKMLAETMQKKQAVAHALDQRLCSEWRACRYLGLHRSTYRYPSKRRAQSPSQTQAYTSARALLWITGGEVWYLDTAIDRTICSIGLPSRTWAEIPLQTKRQLLKLGRILPVWKPPIHVHSTISPDHALKPH